MIKKTTWPPLARLPTRVGKHLLNNRKLKQRFWHKIDLN